MLEVKWDENHQLRPFNSPSAYNKLVGKHPATMVTRTQTNQQANGVQTLLGTHLSGGGPSLTSSLPSASLLVLGTNALDASVESSGLDDGRTDLTAFIMTGFPVLDGDDDGDSSRGWFDDGSLWSVEVDERLSVGADGDDKRQELMTEIKYKWTFWNQFFESSWSVYICKSHPPASPGEAQK